MTVVSEVMMYKKKAREHEDGGPLKQGLIQQELLTYYYTQIWKIRVELPPFCANFHEKIQSKYGNGLLSQLTLQCLKT